MGGGFRCSELVLLWCLVGSAGVNWWLWCIILCCGAAELKKGIAL